MSEHDGKSQVRQGKPQEMGAEALRARRFLALGLLVVAVLFVGVVLGVLVASSLSDKETPPSSPPLAALEARLVADPGDEALKEALREEDQQLRQAYFSRRRRVSIGAVLLLAGVVSALLCARWYASLDPKQVMPKPLAERIDEDRWLGLRRRSLLAVAGAGGALVLLLLVMVFVGGASYLRPEWTGLAAPGAVVEPPTDTGEAAAIDTLDEAGFTENWPRFRGPTGMGIVEAGEWPRPWAGESGENILWKTGVPMPGKSSPVIWGKRIFLTGADAQKQEVFCYRRDTGDLLWRTVVAVPKDSATSDEDDELEVFEETGYAASTPATDGERVYVVFATADVAAVDMSGGIVWSRNLGNPENMYGLATSLLVHKGLVLFQFDRGGDPDEGLSALLAMDAKTGETVWSTSRPVDNSWTTPVVVETESGAELVTSGDPWIIAYDPELGGELWRAEGPSGDVAPSPVYANGMVYVTSEYAQTMAIRAGGLGVVTETHVAWTSDEGVLADAASPVCDGAYLFLVHSSGQMCCHQAETGEVLWEADVDSSVWASPTLVGRMVYFFGDDGMAYLFELGGEYELAGTASLGEGVFASPAFADSQIYVRGEDHLFCIAEMGDTQ